MTLSSGLENVSQSGSVIYKKNADGGRVQKVTAGSGLFMTAIVTKYGQTAPTVALCANGEMVSGVIIGQFTPYTVDLTYDSDNTFTAAVSLQLYIPNRGDILYGTTKTATAITADTWVDVDGGFLTSGTEYIILYEWDQGL